MDMDLVLYYGFVLLILTFIYLTGHLIHCFWKDIETENEYELLFRKLLIGTITIITSYALIKTSGNTLFLGVLFSTLIYLYWMRKSLSSFRLNSFFQVETKAFPILLLGITIFFVYVVCTLEYGLNESLSLNSVDASYYASLATFINDTGIESAILNNLCAMGPSMYHYTNEWLTACIASISGINCFYVYIYIFTPLMLGILYYGVYVLTRRFFIKPVWVHILISLLFFIITGFSFTSGCYLFQVGSMSIYIAQPFINQSGIKLMLIFSLQLYIVLHANKEMDISFLYSLSLLPFLWSTLLPGVVGGAILFLLFLFLFKKEKIHKGYFLVIFPLFFFLLFYGLQSGKSDLARMGVFTSLLEYVKSEDWSLLQHFVYLLTTVVSRIYYYFPFILLFLLSKELREIVFIKYRMAFLLFFCMMVTALISRCILLPILDGHQVWDNLIDSSSFFIFSFMLLCSVLAKTNIKGKIIFCFIVFYSILGYGYTIYTKLSIPYQKPILQKELVKEFSGQIFSSAFMQDESFQDCNKYFTVNHNVYIPLYQIRNITSSYYPVSLSVPDIGKHIPLENKDVRYVWNALCTENLFYQFARKNKLEGDTEQAKYLFLETYKIDYLIYSRESLLAKKLLSLLNIEKTIRLEGEAFDIVKLKW